MIDAARAFGLEDLLTSSNNGYHASSHAECFGCKQEFEATPRQMAAPRRWCPECKAAGKPSAQRQKDLRERRSKVER